MKQKPVEIRTRLCQRLERIAAEEGLSLDELVDHVLRSYTEQYDLDDNDEGEIEDE